MQWYVTFSVAACATLFVGVLGQLCLASFFVWNNDANAPLDQNDEWILHVIVLIPFSIAYLLLSIFIIWVLASKDKLRFFISILIGNFLGLIVAVYFAVIFAIQMDAAPTSAEALFKETKISIASNMEKTGDKRYIHKWLDTVQKQSKDCCGIMTFRDWEEFWPHLETEIPMSCCKDPDSPERCPTNLAELAFPGTPSMFIKTDTGCMDEINNLATKCIHQTFIYAVIICVLVAVAEIAYFIQFYQQYVPLSKSQSSKDDDANVNNDQLKSGGPECGDPYSLDIQSSSYAPFSAYSSSLQTSAGSLQDSGMNLRNNEQAFGASITMGSYEPLMPSIINPGRGTSSRSGSQSALPDQTMMLPPTVSSTEFDFDSPNGTDDEGKKKKKKKKSRKNRDTSAAGGVDDFTTENLVKRDEVFMAPDTTNRITLVDDGGGYSSNPNPSNNYAVFGSNSRTNTNNPLDDNGEGEDQLAEGMLPLSKKDNKGKFVGMTRNRRRH